MKTLKKEEEKEGQKQLQKQKIHHRGRRGKEKAFYELKGWGILNIKIALLLGLE